LYEGYEGWEIKTYRRVSREQLTLELKARFNCDGYSFSENTYSGTVIIYDPTREKIQVIFPEQYGSYQVTLQSTVFGIRAKDERAHKKLFKKTWQKIPWRKEGFWLKGGTRIPIHRFRPLRMK